MSERQRANALQGEGYWSKPLLKPATSPRSPRSEQTKEAMRCRLAIQEFYASYDPFVSSTDNGED